MALGQKRVLKFFYILHGNILHENAGKLMRSQLLLKLEQLLNETCKNVGLGIAAKFRMHLLGSLIELTRIIENLMHGNFLESFIKL